MYFVIGSFCDLTDLFLNLVRGGPVDNNRSIFYNENIRIKPFLSNGIRAALIHWGRVTHLCVDKLTIIGSDNGLSPGQRQAITWPNAGILLIGHFGTNVSEILSGIQTFSFTKMHLKMSSAKWRPFCLGLNVLNYGSWLIVLTHIPPVPHAMHQ